VRWWLISIPSGFEKEMKEALTTMATATAKRTGCEQFVANVAMIHPK